MSKNKRKILKNLRGVVVSDRMQKTVVVEVTRLKQHPKYKKQYRVTNRYKAHDEKGEYHTGDKVIIQECRPFSKDKRWRVKGFVQKSEPAVAGERFLVTKPLPH